MSKRGKLRRKLRNNPQGRTKREIETLLGYFGFSLDRVSGSHHVFILRDGEIIHRLVVPIHRQQVKSIYVKQILEKIDELFPPEEDEEGSEAGDDE
jgi:predicted RNA binding protein YcfA (HicA-like mRNA interferase family)